MLIPISWQSCGMLAHLTANVLIRQSSNAYLILTVIFLLTRVPCWRPWLLLTGWSGWWPRRSAISCTCWVARGLSGPHVSIVRVLCTTLLHAWRWLVASTTLIVPMIGERYFTPFLCFATGSNIIPSPQMWTLRSLMPPRLCRYYNVMILLEICLWHTDTSYSSLHIQKGSGDTSYFPTQQPFQECLQNDWKQQPHHMSVCLYGKICSHWMDFHEDFY